MKNNKDYYLKVKMLPAFWGDAILLNYSWNNRETNIIIDGGIKLTYHRVIKDELKKIHAAGQNVDLLIITHVDDDHIGGIIELFRESDFSGKNFIKKVWFNSGSLLSHHFSQSDKESREIPLHDGTAISAAQGNSLEKLLERLNIWDRRIIHEGEKLDLNHALIEVCSPSNEALEALHNKWEYEKDKSTAIAASHTDYDKSIEELAKDEFSEDTSTPNGSSIGIIVSFDNKTLLFPGDAHASQITRYLASRKKASSEHPFHFDFIKLSHHGSTHNMSPDLLKLITCSNYGISTNGGVFKLPDKECLSRIVLTQSGEKGVTFFYNYNDFKEKIFTDDELKRYNIQQEFTGGKEYCVEIM